MNCNYISDPKTAKKFNGNIKNLHCALCIVHFLVSLPIIYQQT